ncbi:MAG: hypothetical protein AAFR21_06075 [Pseudomonadota bacterium]
MKIGVSGHRERDGADWAWTRDEITKIFLGKPGAIGWSCLAIGADQIFAEAAISFGAGHVAVIPSPKTYRDEFEGQDALRYDALLTRSRRTVKVNARTREAAFRVAGEKVVKSVDEMVVVWDGDGARREGGTGEVVDFARARGVPCTWLDPIEKMVRTFGPTS